MLCDFCKSKPVAKGIKEIICFCCREKSMVNCAWNANLCEKCSNDRVRCVYCGKSMSDNSKIDLSRKKIAVDFDGTLCKQDFPNIGEIEPKHQKVIDYIKREKNNEAIIILWTCREDMPERAYLTEAVDWCRENNIPIDHVNVYYQPEFKGFASRKVNADEYIDDKAINVEDIV